MKTPQKDSALDWIELAASFVEQLDQINNTDMFSGYMSVDTFESRLCFSEVLSDDWLEYAHKREKPRVKTGVPERDPDDIFHVYYYGNTAHYIFYGFVPKDDRVRSYQYLQCRWTLHSLLYKGVKMI